jgi:sialate O-acetylesterase
MELPIRRVLDLYESEVANFTNDHIRFFHIPTSFKFGPPNEDLPQGRWDRLNPSTALQMSAAAYFFAKDLYEELHVPIGLIINAVGGSPAEAWLSEETIKRYPSHANEYRKYLVTNAVEKIRKEESEEQMVWHTAMQRGDLGNIEGWQYGPAPSSWHSTSLPAQWNSNWFPELAHATDPIIGSVWFKKEIILPEIVPNTPVRLDLGTIIDADDVYVNGLPVGATAYRYPPRIYRFDSSLFKKGKNIITIRVRAYGGNGQFIADKPYTLQIGNQKIDIRNDWKYQLGYYTDRPLPATTTLHYQPSSLYKALLYPLKNLKLKGVLWYQGESNTSDPREYRQLFPDVIADWRSLFGQNDLPFLYVQLASYMQDPTEPTESNWAELRQVQLECQNIIPHTAMITTIDVGEWNDIHPLNKKAVGKRLALAARHIAYQQNVLWSGPIYKQQRIKGNKIYIYFDHVGTGLRTRDHQKLTHYAIAGNDGKYVWANAELQNDYIIVWSDRIQEPVSVRYAWGNNPHSANLTNSAGLPASPFSTARQH